MPTPLEQLLALANDNHYRVTSSTGGQHNAGSLHGSGRAIDIDHRGVDYNALQAQVAAMGGRVLDERTRPAGQKVWGGPHFHIELPGGGSTASQAGPSVTGSTPEYTPAKPIPIGPTMFGGFDELQTRLNSGGPAINPEFSKGAEAQQAALKESQPQQAFKPIEVVAPPTDYKPSDLTQSLISEIRNAKPITYDQPKPEPTLLEEFGSGFTQPLTGYNQDEAAQQNQGKPVYIAGELAGNIVAQGGAALAGTGIGGPVGGITGLVGSGGILGARAEAQRQRLAGEKEDIVRQLGVGVIEGGLNAITPVGKGLSIGRRVALNAAVQGGASGLGVAASEGIRQGTFTPDLDPRMIGTAITIGAGGGAVGGIADPRLPQPERALAPRQPIQVGRTGSIAPETPRVTVQTPSIKQTAIEIGEPLEIGQPKQPVVPDVVEPPPATVDYAVPSKPKVEAIEYEPQQLTLPVADGIDVPPSPTSQLDTVDSALYDLANNPADEVALKAAREALPGYGDENIRALGQQVKQLADDAIDTNQPVPKGMAKRLVEPPPVRPDDAVMMVEPKPDTPELMRVKDQQLRGNRQQMVESGTQGSIIKTVDDYKAMRQRLKSLGNMSENRLNNLDDLIPEAMLVRGQELLTAIDTGEFRMSNRTPGGRAKQLEMLQRRVAEMEAGTINGRTMNALKRQIVDMDYQLEKQNMLDQMNQLHEGVRIAFDHGFDEKTGLMPQKVLNGGKTFEEVADELTGDVYAMARTLKDVIENDARIKIDADTNVTGATSNVGEREITPIGFIRDKDGAISVQAYNPDGHLARYYLTPKVLDDGTTSQIRAIGDVVNRPGFKGEYANITKGVGQIPVEDILKRTPRPQGIKTAEALKVAEKALALSKEVDLAALNPKFAKIMDDIRTNPRALSIQTVEQLEDVLKVDKNLLGKLCSVLGKVG